MLRRLLESKEGEKLRGNLIKKSLIGDIAYVYKEKMFFVSDNGTVNNLINKKQILTQEQKVVEVIGSLKKLEVKGRSMEKLRTSVNLYDASKCSELRRERQKLAEKLNTNISELELVEPLTMFLGAASTEMQTCVSCSATRALDSCNRAKEYIKDAEKQLRGEAP